MSATRSSLEQLFLDQWQLRFPDLPPVEQFTIPEWRGFAREQKRRGPPMRADFAWPAAAVALELQGGTWGRRRSGHSTGKGIQQDCIKTFVAQSAGWVLLPMTTTMLQQQELIWLPRIADCIRLRMPAATDNHLALVA
jgi:hypothetical protein